MASKPARPPAQPHAAGFTTRRDGAWLLPYNRKLRNLVSISLRNLSLASPHSPARARKNTIDDAALPSTLQSPAKLVALREQKALGHSRSSTDLRSSGDLRRVPEHAVTDASADSDGELAHANGSPKGKQNANGLAVTPQRPKFARMRRRSTLEWANASPQKRQEKLENVTAERMADVFYSLHVEGVEEPVYVSEVIERTMNPTFRHISFSFSACAPGITRLDKLTIRFWIKRAKSGDWKQLLELSLSLRSAQHIGKHLHDFRHALPQNAVILHMTDGVYAVFPSLSDYAPASAAPPVKAGSTRVLLTSSFDALLRLAKLDDSIQDALETRDKLASDLEKLLESHKQALVERDTVAEAADRLKTIEFAKKTVEKQLQKASKQQAEKRASLDMRRRLMSQDLESRAEAAKRLPAARDELPSLRAEAEVRKKATAAQRRRICEDLHNIYPIQPVPNQNLAFTIRGQHLPNSEHLDASPPDIVAAALGHVAHVLLLLSFYLAQPLPYPVAPRGNTSVVEDPISLLRSNASTTQKYQDERSLRTYPLFSKGVPRFRFEYAVFLLNKDVQSLLEAAFGVRVVDVRHTLPNLKYLLYVATAGEGELPARKAGGVRGLVMSRSGSQDSGGRDLGGLLWHGYEDGKADAGKGKGAVESLKKNMGGLLDGRR